MPKKKPRKLNGKRTFGEVYIEGTKYTNKDANKDNIIKWLQAIQDKYT